MRFKSRPRLVPRSVTSRRIKAAEKALANQRASLPLLQDWVEEQQPTPEERIQGFDSALVQHEIKRRIFEAQTWRRARTILYSLNDQVRSQALIKWNSCSIPATSSYFLDFIQRFTNG